MVGRVSIVEVGPRDGLQAEEAVLTADVRGTLIRRLASAGAARIEVASFVRPDRVPQMAGAEEICAGLDPDRTWSAIGLVLNRRGLERALAASLDEVNLVAYASDGYSLRNTGRPAADRNEEVAALATEAVAAGCRAGVTVAVAFGDPVDGDVPVSQVADLAAALWEAGATELNLGDTIGAAVPSMVGDRIAAVREAAPDLSVRCHFHNTRNNGFANVMAALDAGVDAIDSSIGGYGGSPFSPGAGGNVATEDLVWMLERMGRDTGMDLRGLMATSVWLAEHLGDGQPRSMLPRVGPFP